MSTEQEEVQDVPATEDVQVAEPTEIEAPEPSAQSEDDAMQAGFDAVNGIEEPEPEPVPEPKLIAGYTEDEVKKAFATIAALEQRESKVFGSLGSMKQALDALKSAPQPSAPQPMNISVDRLKRMSAEFPEIANLLAQDLSEVMNSGASANPQQIEEIVEQRVKTSLDKASQAYEARFLTVQHPDWKTIVKADDFVGWKEGLPPDERAELDTSWDAEFIGEKITQFKEWKSKTVQSKQTNQRRLEAAITPKGTSSTRPAPTENDAFMAGFKSVRGT